MQILPRSNKKPRLSNTNVEDGGRHSDSALDSLDPALFAMVISFINPRDLLHLSMCSKRFSQTTRINHDHVVTSALLSGGKAKRIATQVMEMALPLSSTAPSRTSIHLPTPIRLLRLVNGTRCESRACSSAVTASLCPRFGLFLCWDCFFSLTTAVDLKHEVIATKKRMARLYRSKAHVVKIPFIDASGEIAGPIVTWDVASGPRANKEVDALLNQADLAWPLETYEIIRRSLRDNNIQVSSRHEVGIPLADSILLMNRLQGMLEDMHCPYSDVLTSFDEYQQPFHDGSGLHLSSVVFHSNLVYELVDEFVSRPISFQNQVTERQLQRIADQLGQAMQTLTDSDFLDFSFLDERNRWENGLRQHFRKQTQPYFSLRAINSDMLEEINEGNLFGAMLHLENNYSITPPNDPDRPIGNWAGVFADVVLAQNAKVIRRHRLITESCARDLAKITYIDLVAEPSVAFDDEFVDDDDNDEDDEEGNKRAEFTERCDVAAVAFQELLPLTQALIELIDSVALLVAQHINPRARRIYVKLMTAQLGKLRGDVVTRFRNRDFVSILDELCQNLG